MRVRIKGGWAVFSTDGIAIAPWFTRRRAHVPWSNVMFVSPTPAVRRRSDGWVTYLETPITSMSLKQGLRFYVFDIAVKDRAAVRHQAGFRIKVWLASRQCLVPLWTPEEKPHPREGVLSLQVRKSWVRDNGTQLLAALEICEKASRFGSIGVA